MQSNYILNSYHNAFGNEVIASAETKGLIAQQLGSFENTLPKIAVLENSLLCLGLPCENLIWKIYREDNQILEGQSKREGDVFNLKLDLTIGYYELELCNLEHKLLLVAAPQKAYIPDILYQKKFWGLTTQLYSLSKTKSGGFGDFSALKELKTSARQLGASFIGLNPLLATGFPKNVGISPYSPVSRFALNEMYISCDLQDQRREIIDYQNVANQKHKIFFQRYLKERKDNYLVNKELKDYAVFSSLRDIYGAEWQKWPEEFRKPENYQIKKFIDENKEKINYYLFLQELAKKELESITSKNIAEDLVLYLDFPVGVSLNSADVWANQSLYALSASAGAPPDELAPQGQSWGLPPMIPERLLEQSCKPFINALRFTMQYAGAIRIDHVMSLWRLYWAISNNKGSNNDGAYVKYPAKELTSILKLESHLNQCIVIGEDLGTVPEETKQFMSSSGVLSYKVFYFEKDYNDFKQPESYPKESLCCVGTHDLATLKGYLEKTDLEERKELKLHNEETLKNLYKNREADLEALKRLLNINHLSFDEVLEKLHQKLLNSNSLLTAIQIEDLLGLKHQVNLPGTVDQRPNWKQLLENYHNLDSFKLKK